MCSSSLKAFAHEVDGTVGRENSLIHRWHTANGFGKDMENAGEKIQEKTN
ncbi:MAG: entericidin A/B family lipoprotein [Verrucomicrobia bacterium]|nr:entericidin A/B family lipoprotein [Verrucomicrobiota bacterium]